jgi:hypothetical protein
MSDATQQNQGQEPEKKKSGGILDALKPGGRGLDDPDKKPGAGSSTLRDMKPSAMPGIPKSMQPGSTNDPGSTHSGAAGGTGIKNVGEAGGGY